MARLEGWDFVYDGEINKYNKYHGHGILRTTEGYTYEGEFENGTFCEGKMTDNYGVVYEGYFITGTLFGEGKITHPTALVYEGEFNLLTARVKSPTRADFASKAHLKKTLFTARESAPIPMGRQRKEFFTTDT